ncbi:MAG: hypothetical protein FD123_1745 [Bacteroidetes bacterium]|nr:MAG: hypothetical protein FD123_1745 [Bacteroidota bacterium]
MRARRKITFPLLLLHLLFLAAPTLLVMYVVIRQINQSYTFIEPGDFWQVASFGIGMVVAYIMYLYRARFFITFGVLLFIEWTIYKSIAFLPGEFDVFFTSIRFWYFSSVFTTSWLIGFGLARWRYFPVMLAALLLTLTMALRADTQFAHNSMTEFMEYGYRTLLPILAYVLYMVFMAESLRDLLEVSAGKVLRLSGRLVLFLVVMLSVFIGVSEYLEPPTKPFEAIFGGGAPDSSGGEGGVDTSSMMKKNPNDGKHSMKDYAQMKNNLGSGGNKLLFCAYLPNFLGPDSIPNPLYFTSYYLTYYDTAHERFERDSMMPSNDLFCPEPVSIPLFKTFTDTSVIRKGRGDKMRRTVSCDIYYKELSTRDFVSPSTAFSCQPITVEEEFRKEFPFAVKTKSYISELNSAYFVYNSDNPSIKAFQEIRFKELRKVKNYDKLDKEFLDYYTTNPKGPLFDSIAALAKEIGADAKTPIDKVLAVRDYFLSKDEFGEPKFVYSLQVGKADDPNIANARMLRTFLFKERKGYCTYYAGSTLFMLRSMGVPVRFVCGFLTEDRASKNKGWYWFYSNQGHAWVQVYFPGYGWLDFDTTVSNTDQRDAPRPDGTPPLQPPRAWLVVNGVAAEDADTVKKQIKIKVTKGIFYDKDFLLPKEMEFAFDAAQAKVVDEKGPRSLKEAHKGDSILVIAYDDASKRVPRPTPGVTPEQQVMRADQPVIADEIHLEPIAELKKPETQKKKPLPTSFSWWTLLWGGLGLLAFLLLLFFLIPTICYLWYRSKARNSKTPKEKAYWIYRYSMFTFNQLGILRDETETPLEYAREKIDKTFQCNFEAFMRVYLKVKYANLPPDNYDEEVMAVYLPAFAKPVFAKYKFHKLLAKFLNVSLTHRFLKRPREEKNQ